MRAATVVRRRQLRSIAVAAQDLLVVAAITFKFYRKFYCKFYCTCDRSLKPLQLIRFGCFFVVLLSCSLYL